LSGTLSKSGHTQAASPKTLPALALCERYSLPHRAQSGVRHVQTTNAQASLSTLTTDLQRGHVDWMRWCSRRRGKAGRPLVPSLKSGTAWLSDSARVVLGLGGTLRTIGDFTSASVLVLCGSAVSSSGVDGLALGREQEAEKQRKRSCQLLGRVLSGPPMPRDGVSR
jgi:hypothetical protein